MPTYSQSFGGGGELQQSQDNASSQIDAIHSQIVQKARSMGLNVPEIDTTNNRANYQKLEYPLQLAPTAKGNSTFHISNFVDHDAGAGLQDFTCGTRTYNGHRGIDIFPSTFSWWRMDQGNQNVVAVAPGVITAKQDGNEDRRCGTLSTIGNFPANYVIVTQDDGLLAYYWHMKTGSVTSLNVGARVEAGTILGKVGSSGFTTGPHLHLELRTAGGATVDPFTGACSSSPSVWKHQWPANSNFSITQVATLSAVPSFAQCTNGIAGQDTPNFSDQFSAGQTVYLVTFLRDLAGTQSIRNQVYDPSGTMIRDFTYNTSNSNYYASYWYGYFTLSNSAQSGKYRYRITVGSEVSEGAFFVSMPPANPNLFASVQPGGRSVQTGITATAFANILNASSNTAYGCGIYPETPFAGSFWFQTTNPATNQLAGTQNQTVDIAGNTTQTFAMGITPSAGFDSSGVTMKLRFKCANGNAAPHYKGVNTLNVSFSGTAVPDIIPIAVTGSGDGTVRTGGIGQTGTYFVSAVNIGPTATLNVSSFVPVVNNITSQVCEIDGGGTCISSQAGNVSISFPTNAPKLFKVEVTANSAVPFLPAENRSGLRFEDANGLRGETSVALTTDP